MRTILFILFSIVYVSAQSDYWPEALYYPYTEEQDLNINELSSKQDLHRGVYKTKNSLTYKNNDSIKQITQKIQYNFSDDKPLNIQNHFLDLSGSIKRKQIPFNFTSIGIEWMPAAALHNNNNIGSMRLGPTIDVNYLTLPIHMSGGAAVDIWNVRHNLSTRSDPGFYGNISIGDNTLPLWEQIPIYAGGEIYGTYMSNSKITTGKVDMLFAQKMPFAEGMFIYGADTLSKGRTAFFNEQGGGIPEYSTTDNKIINSLQLSIGLLNIGKTVIKPSIGYTLCHNSNSYPTPDRLLADNQNTKNIVFATLITDSGWFFDYNAGIQFTFEKEDWLYKEYFKTGTKKTSQNSDSLVENNKDFNGFHAKMFHFIGKSFTNGMNISYSVNLERYQKIFTEFYVWESGNSYDTSTQEDNDRVNYNHTLNLTLLSKEKITFTGLGQYIRNERVFLRKEKSTQNQTNRIYRLETMLDVTPSENLLIKETIGIVGKNSDYHTPEVHKYDFPSFSRRIYSKMNINIFINTLKLNIIFNEVYRDNGYWKSHKYMNDEDLSNANYYAIEQKALETNLELSGTVGLSQFVKLKIGSLFQNTIFWKPDIHNISPDQEYIIENKGNYLFRIKPYLKMQALLFDKLTLTAGITCHSELTIINDNNNSNIFKGEIDYWEAISLFKMDF